MVARRGGLWEGFECGYKRAKGDRYCEDENVLYLDYTNMNVNTATVTL